MESITSQKLGSHDFWEIDNIVFNKDKSAIYLLYSSNQRLLSSTSEKAKFAKNLSKNSDLDDSKNSDLVSLYLFSLL